MRNIKMENKIWRKKINLIKIMVRIWKIFLFLIKDTKKNKKFHLIRVGSKNVVKVTNLH